MFGETICSVLRLLYLAHMGEILEIKPYYRISRICLLLQIRWQFQIPTNISLSIINNTETRQQQM